MSQTKPKVNKQPKKLISIVTPCFNEEENVQEVYKQIKKVMHQFKRYRYEHIFIDNASKDRTVEILKKIAKSDKNVKIIVNTRNFGHIRSPYHAFLQSKGDAACFLAADLQDPPHLITEFLKKWQEGYKLVVATKKQSKESPLIFWIRSFFYKLICRLSEVELIPHFMGFGLYDKKVVDILRKIDDPYPYFRGLISEIGFEVARVEYVQPKRKRGITKNNIYSLYDMAMLGITNHSKVPLRLTVMAGFVVAVLSVLFAIGYLIYKLIFWNTFSAGIAPLVIGLFFFGSLQLIFLGIIGEYIGSIHTQVLKRPHVIEKERINF